MFVESEKEVDSFEPLLKAARDGDAAALGRVLTEFQQYLLSIAGSAFPKTARTKVAPSDVVQDTFIEAQRLFVRFEGEKSEEMRAWLRAILLNKLRKTYRQFNTAKRHANRERSLDESRPGGKLADQILQSGGTPSAAASANEQADGLRKALDRLGDPHRQVILWRNFEKLSFAEIGQRLGRSDDAVRMLYNRALERLQDSWDGGDGKRDGNPTAD